VARALRASRSYLTLDCPTDTRYVPVACRYNVMNTELGETLALLAVASPLGAPPPCPPQIALAALSARSWSGTVCFLASAMHFGYGFIRAFWFGSVFLSRSVTKARGINSRDLKPEEALIQFLHTLHRPILSTPSHRMEAELAVAEASL